MIAESTRPCKRPVRPPGSGLSEGFRGCIRSGMGVWPCRAKEAEPKIPGPCVRGARAGVSRAPLARPRAGGLRSRRLAIRSAGASLRLADSRGGHGAFAPWPPRIVRISRLCRSANGKSTMVGIQCLRAFPSGEAASGRPPRGGVRSSPPLQGHERAGPHRLRAASRIAAPPPCSPRAHARFALSLAPCGRSRTAADGAAPAYRTTCCKFKLSDRI